MKQLAEFIPIALFFIVYQLDGESIALGGWEYHFDGIFSVDIDKAMRVTFCSR